jgi:DNA-binding response OmpR family regulator
MNSPQLNKTILIVEDERPLANAIKIKLELNGFETVTARSVAQALDYLENINEINAIWLDHYLLV